MKKKMTESRFWKRRETGPCEALHPSTGTRILVNPQKDCLVDEGDLDREWTRYPALVEWYRSLRDTAKAAYRQARYDEHTTEEDLYVEVSDSLKGGKITETAIKMAVRRHPRMRAAFLKRMDAEKMLQRLDSALESVIDKRWALQSVTKIRLSEREYKDHT